MPTGSVPLLESVKYGSDMLKTGVVETIVQESPIMMRLPFINIEGNALKTYEEGSLPGTAFRQVNASYSRTWGSDREHTWGVAILGGEVFVDNFIVRTRGNVIDVKTRQFQKMAKAMAMKFDTNFFDGTGTANDFKGVNTLISEGFGSVSYGGTNGGAVTLALLDEAIDNLRTGTPDAALLNRKIRRDITSLGRNTANGYSMIDVGNDAFGRQVTQYAGIPLDIVGDDHDGNLILGFDETRGSSNVTASMYFVRYGRTSSSPA